MATANPYAAPKAAVEDVGTGEPELATRGQRLRAAVVDGLVYVVAGAAAGLLASMFGAPKGVVFGASLTATLGVVGLINLWLLVKYRATVGKLSAKIRMVRSDGSEAGVLRLVFLRGLPQWAVGLAGNLVPFASLLSLVDVLFIFGKPRRCVHDYIADTIVVRAE